MALRSIKGTVLLLIFSAGLLVISCKGKEKNREMDTTTNADTTMTAPDTSTAVTPAPVTITEAQLKDATKDFPGVQATVNNGEVTLTGSISKEKLPRLMQSVQALNPVKVNNNLTIK